MGIAELFRTINTTVQTGASTDQYEKLAHDTSNLADMVGWAPGLIDPEGEWLERLAQLQNTIEIRQRQTQELTLMLLNDRLTYLGQTIARHDADVSGSDEDDVNDSL